LILNELLSNCYKHAFKGRPNGKILISFTKEGETLFLIVRDNGVGLKEGYKETGSLGVVVIESLVEQLDGRHKFSVQDGTSFEMEFEQHISIN
nr:sensor histidine kinase [Bacteroidota bacterium]